jgi:signal transduction histidine kinase
MEGHPTRRANQPPPAARLRPTPSGYLTELLELCAVRLGDVARAAVDILRPTAETKKISIDLVIDAVVSVDGDAARLQQIVDNLLTNAIKFTPENGRITLRVDRTVSEAMITVADTGKGISADFLPYIFDAFRQAETPPSRLAGSGLGLGLTIVHHLVQLHGGTTHAESDGQGRGARFTVRLPAANNGEPGS